MLIPIILHIQTPLQAWFMEAILRELSKTIALPAAIFPNSLIRSTHHDVLFEVSFSLFFSRVEFMLKTTLLGS